MVYTFWPPEKSNSSAGGTVPRWLRWLTGESLAVTFGLNRIEKPTDGYKICGTAKTVYTGKDNVGIGFHFIPELGWDGFDLGVNLYTEYAQTGSAKGLAKTGAGDSERVPIPAGQPFGILSVTYATGTADATLLTPWGEMYDKDDTAGPTSTLSPVLYRKNDSVQIDGQTKNEICFFIKPRPGETTVTPGEYQVALANAQGVLEYNVELFLPYPPPMLSLTQPAVDTVVDPGTPLLQIGYTGTAPAATPTDVEIQLFYDNNAEGYDGQLINYTVQTGAEPYVGPSPIDLTSAAFDWNTSNIPTGDYVNAGREV